MLQVTNPKSGKTYTYAHKNVEKAHALAEKLGVKVEYVVATPKRRHNPLCVCGRPEDSHESYDCQKDYKIAPW